MNKRLNGAAIDALSLTFIRIVTILISMVIYKLLAVKFSLAEYGTYSAAMLIVTTVTSMTVLGMTDAINYFYAKDVDAEKGKKYVYTIALIEVVIGLISAGLLILLRNPVAAYFDNEAVAGVIPFIAFMPMLTNLSNMLQVLFVTAQRAKAIAVRNLLISVLKVVSVAIVCWWLNDITTVIIITLALEIGNVIYMFAYCKKNIFRVEIFKADLSLTREILKYSIPMAAYVLTSTMSKNIDKLVIGALGGQEILAIYSIASKELPFDILTTSFLTVLVPYITRNIGCQDYKSGANTFSKYIQITYIVTWIIASGALVCSKDLMLILYDEKYLSGIGVFCLYILVDMLKFATVSIIFSILNKAKELLCYSGLALVVNTILNVIFYHIMGMIGPAVSTLVITLALAYITMSRSAYLLKTRVTDLVNFKQMILIACECLISGAIAFAFKTFVLSEMLPLFSFVITYIIYFAPLVGLNYKKILALLKEINQMKL